MEEASKPEFSKWRRRLWPVHSYELKKFLPLILIKFLISLNYGIMTCLKDAMVVTAKGSGAEAIPILKGWVVLPLAILLSLLYAKCSSVMKRSTLFYMILGGFMLVVFSYGFILCPNASFFSPDASSDWLLSQFGARIGHWVAVYRNWIHSLIFVTAELWASMVIFLLFWGMVNEISSVKEAKRSYTIYIAAGNVGAILTGPTIAFFSDYLAQNNLLLMIKGLCGVLILVGFTIMGLYWFVENRVKTDKRFYDPDTIVRKEAKEKLSLMDGIKLIAKSRSLLYIAVLVVGYGLVINLVEVSWKANLKLQYPNTTEYLSVVKTVFSSVGFISFIVSILFFGGIIRKLGWRFAALITPIAIGATGILFLLCSLYRDSIGGFTQLIGLTPLMFLVVFGAMQNVTSKVVKYSFFDPTKEIAYIPLSDDEKIKGKAAVDVVGSRLGKSGSAWIQIGLLDLMATSSVLSITHLIIPLVLLTVIAWIYSIRNLNRQIRARDAQEASTVEVEETTSASGEVATN